MLEKFTNFDQMITPSIIKIVFWIGTVFSVLMGLFMVVSGLGAVYGGGSQVFAGIMIIIIGPLSIRIYCELIIIIFKIHEALVDIREK